MCRLAPLSEGRIEPDGNLMCSYHAWRFNGEGKCVALPQAKDEESFRKIVSQPRYVSLKSLKSKSSCQSVCEVISGACREWMYLGLGRLQSDCIH